MTRNFKTLISIIFMFFLSSILFCENPSYINYGGKKLKKTKEFHIIGVKTSQNKNNKLSIEIYFNDVLNAQSVKTNKILINKKPLPQDTRFYFSKNAKILKFYINNTHKNFDICILGLKSFDNKKLKVLELNNLSSNTFYKINKETKEWQKY